jgi:hypothetical protein
MSWQQIVQPDASQAAQPGWCLNHVQRVYAAPWSGSTATDGWNRAQFKHPNETPPAGVSAPVWFAMKGEPAGHVVAWLSDGSILSASSGNQNAVVHHPNLQHLSSYYGGRLTLRGWSEDIGGRRITEEKEEVVKATKEQVESLAQAYLGDSLARNPGLEYYIGMELDKVIGTFNDSAQRDVYLKNQENVLAIANLRGARLDDIAKLVGAKNGDDVGTITENIKRGLGGSKFQVIDEPVYKEIKK